MVKLLETDCKLGDWFTSLFSPSFHAAAKACTRKAIWVGACSNEESDKKAWKRGLL